MRRMLCTSVLYGLYGLYVLYGHRPSVLVRAIPLPESPGLWDCGLLISDFDVDLESRTPKRTLIRVATKEEGVKYP